MSAKILKGVVLSTEQKQTIVVRVERARMHEVYGKRFSSHKKYQVHNAGVAVKAGDLVHITQCAPKSKTKHWELKEVIK